MTSMVTHTHAELAPLALRPTNAGALPALPTRYRLRTIASDVAMVVAVLAFVLSFFALRMTLFTPADVGERVAIPLAAGAAVVFVLALLGSLALRPGDASGPNR